MPTKDANQVASRILRETMWRHVRFEKARALDYRQAWREARAEARKRPSPRVKEGPRVQYPKLSPAELSRVGDIDGLL